MLYKHRHLSCIPCGVNVPQSPFLQKKKSEKVATANLQLNLYHEYQSIPAAYKNKLGNIL